MAGGFGHRPIAPLSQPKAAAVFAAWSAAHRRGYEKGLWALRKSGSVHRVARKRLDAIGPERPEPGAVANLSNGAPMGESVEAHTLLAIQRDSREPDKQEGP